MAGFVSLSGGTASSNQNFYGFKFDAATGECTIEEVLYGDTSVVIKVPQLNDDLSFYNQFPESYLSTALTPYELDFSWDTTDASELIMEVL
jgi:hypothetical protein